MEFQSILARKSLPEALIGKKLLPKPLGLKGSQGMTCAAATVINKNGRKRGEMHFCDLVGLIKTRATLLYRMNGGHEETRTRDVRPLKKTPGDCQAQRTPHNAHQIVVGLRVGEFIPTLF
jgi:hypothetical protein